MTVRRSIFSLALSALLAIGCNQTQTEPPPPYVGPEAQVMEFTTAEAIYYGDDGNTEKSDMWNIRLTGHEQMIQISCNTIQADEADPEYLVGYYTEPKRQGVYTPDSFNPGYMLKIEFADGSIEGPVMSYYGEFTSNGEVVVDLLSEGFVNIDANTDGTFTIEGTMVGKKFLKRNFAYMGKLDVIDMTSTSETKSSNDCRYEIDYEMLSDIMRFDFGVHKAGECFRK